MLNQVLSISRQGLDTMLRFISAKVFSWFSSLSQGRVIKTEMAKNTDVVPKEDSH